MCSCGQLSSVWSYCAALLLRFMYLDDFFGLQMWLLLENLEHNSEL